MKAVLDASALLAWLQNEPGAAIVEELLSESAISSLNWSEVLQKSLAHGVEITGLRQDMEALGLVILPFDRDAAEQAARLWSADSSLSLADRACLALGIQHGAPVLTADRLWTQVSVGATVRLVRT
ncbi:MAG TPA: type II toxin-antitoxin system VapC family toxin [Chloroflexi bacterium]|nr:type II toxin-antitoxin system VapC family toxin [Chloroflexota bacterium]